MMRAQEDYNKELESSSGSVPGILVRSLTTKSEQQQFLLISHQSAFLKGDLAALAAPIHLRVVDGIMYFYQSICDYYYDDVGEKDEGEKEEKLLFFIMVNGESICRGVPFISHIKCTHDDSVGSLPAYAVLPTDFLALVGNVLIINTLSTLSTYFCQESVVFTSFQKFPKLLTLRFIEMTDGRNGEMEQFAL